MRFSTLSLAAAILPVLTLAETAPNYAGLNLAWSDDFSKDTTYKDGDFANNYDAVPVTKTWLRFKGLSESAGTTGEIENYSNSDDFVSVDTAAKLLRIKAKQSGGTWMSGHVDIREKMIASAAHADLLKAFTTEAGKKFRLEAKLKYDTGSSKAGFWPAFWTLGMHMRAGPNWAALGWPACGEIDIMESANGELSGHGSLHWGGDRTLVTQLGDANAFHTWAVEIDRTNADFAAQTLTFLKDNKPYLTVHGSEVGQAGWTNLAWMPQLPILNVAVGGNFVGGKLPAAGSTYEMQVAYVAVYKS